MVQSVQLDPSVSPAQKVLKGPEDHKELTVKMGTQAKGEFQEQLGIEVNVGTMVFMDPMVNQACLAPMVILALLVLKVSSMLIWSDVHSGSLSSRMCEAV